MDNTKNHEITLEKLENEVMTRSKSYQYHREIAKEMAEKDIEIERLKEFVSDARREKYENRKLNKIVEAYRKEMSEIEKIHPEIEDIVDVVGAIKKLKEELVVASDSCNANIEGWEEIEELKVKADKWDEYPDHFKSKLLTSWEYELEEQKLKEGRDFWKEQVAIMKKDRDETKKIQFEALAEITRLRALH